MVMLHITACYWVLCASGQLIHLQKTSNWICLDLFRGMVALPRFENCYRLPVVLVQWISTGMKKLSAKKTTDVKKDSHILAILLGILIACICIAIVLPLLLAADAGFARLVYNLFSALFNGMFLWLRRLISLPGIFSFFLQIFVIVPAAFFLYGLVYGCIHSKTTMTIPSSWCKKRRHLPVLRRS